MITKKILGLFSRLPKGYISLEEIVNYLKADKNTIKATLSRLRKQNRIVRLGYGFYALDTQKVDLEQLACEMVYPSYISLEYALSIYGMISQVPANLTFITSKRSSQKQILNTSFEYSHINPKLFFGYKIAKNAYLAYPEKALLDMLYLVGLKKRKINLSELDLAQINKKKLYKWLKLYPQSTRRISAVL